MPVDKTELDEVLKKAKEIAIGQNSSLDTMTIKDLKLAADPDSDEILTNDQKASIISVIIIAT